VIPSHAPFFDARFEKWRDAYREEAIEPVLNKVGAFLAFPAIQQTLGQRRSTLHLSYAMNHARIVICNLASGVVGESGARLFCALMLGGLRTAAMARAKTPPEKRTPFHIIVDELQAFGPTSIVSLLSEIRKYGCSVTAATQFLDGLSHATRAALLGNAGTLAAFRCAPRDADVLAANFDRAQQSFNAYALQDLGIGEAMLRSFQIDPARVNISTPGLVGPAHAAKRQSQQHFGRPRAQVEAYISRVLGY
jgi:hypothetical protein